ncbi:BolA family protein [Pseudoroseicyclus sp. H15]
MAVAEEIETRLREAFHPEELQVVNESAHHAGHAGDDGSGESHWRVVMSAPEFAPLSRVARHRAVHSALGPDLMGRIHALALDLS